jgi:hypothetical protein
MGVFYNDVMYSYIQVFKKIRQLVQRLWGWGAQALVEHAKIMSPYFLIK